MKVKWGEMMQEAILYDKHEDNSVTCNVCHHRCKIAAGKRGFCAVRENQAGKLIALNYGKTIAAHIDPIEKKPLYHFMKGTYSYSLASVGCNMRCAWCQNVEISQSPRTHHKIIGEDISPEEHISRAVKHGVESIAYTYSEPTIFIEYALDIMKLAHKKGLKNVWVSNGYMTQEALDVILPYLDAINIDYKGANDTIMVKTTAAKSSLVLDTIDYIKAHDVHLEVTTLVVPTVNDTIEELKSIADMIKARLGENTPWHISRFFPAWKMKDAAPTNVQLMKDAADYARSIGLKHVHLGNI
ncbi:MAG: AmmeMemoRadiSam system radical SAM enzyme [Bacillota bacterium]